MNAPALGENKDSARGNHRPWAGARGHGNGHDGDL